MSRRVAIVAATPMEIEPLIEVLDNDAFRYSPGHYLLGDTEIDILISGIGILPTTFSLMNYLSGNKPDAWIQAGIGGAFDPALEMGTTYFIESEIIIGFGAQDQDGRIIDQFELGWVDSNEFPFKNKLLTCPYISSDWNIPHASGMTTMHSHGHSQKIEELRMQINGQIENMEGAAFFYISLLKDIPFISMRSVSNFVESRDLSKWNFPVAIHSLNEKLIALLTDDKFLSGLFSSRQP